VSGKITTSNGTKQFGVIIFLIVTFWVNEEKGMVIRFVNNPFDVEILDLMAMGLMTILYLAVFSYVIHIFFSSIQFDDDKITHTKLIKKNTFRYDEITQVEVTVNASSRLRKSIEEYQINIDEIYASLGIHKINRAYDYLYNNDQLLDLAPFVEKIKFSIRNRPNIEMDNGSYRSQNFVSFISEIRERCDVVEIPGYMIPRSMPEYYDKDVFRL
jgi:hypothetical protein